MNTIDYVGERLWIGHIGNGFVVLSFVSALLACILFYISAKNKNHLNFARVAFNLHSISVLGIAGTLFFMLFNHFFGSTEQKTGLKVYIDSLTTIKFLRKRSNFVIVL